MFCTRKLTDPRKFHNVKQIWGILLSVILIIMNSVVLADEVDCAVEQSSFTNETNPLVNYGTAANLNMGPTGVNYDVYYTYVQSDLSELPDGADVTAAYIFLNTTTLGSSITQVYYGSIVTEAWDESTITCINAPATGSQVFSTNTTTSSINQWKTFEITSAVETWLSNPSSNHGLMIFAIDDFLNFASDDFSDESRRPYIWIEYTIPSGSGGIASLNYFSGDDNQTITSSGQTISPNDISVYEITVTHDGSGAVPHFYHLSGTGVDIGPTGSDAASFTFDALTGPNVYTISIDEGNGGESWTLEVEQVNDLIWSEGTEYNFGESVLNNPVEHSFTLTNQGNNSAEISSISVAAPFSITQGDLSENLSPGNSHYITVAFTPTSVTSFEEIMIAFCNDANDASITLQGTGIESPNQTPNVAHHPFPSDGAIGIQRVADLEWLGGDPDGDVVTYDVYFGTSSNPSLVKSNWIGNYFDPYESLTGPMASNTTYYWKIVADDGIITSESPVWSFTTSSEVIGNMTFQKGIIDNSFDGAQCVTSGDIDGDGFIDVIGAAYNDSTISWWKNTNGDGSSWSETVIASSFAYAYSVYCVDIDDDNDLDVIGAGYYEDQISLWTNNDGTGLNWTEHIVVTSFAGAHSVYASDINNDGLLDILGVAWEDNKVVWWENTGNNDTWNQHEIDLNFQGAEIAYAKDINGDGNIDVIGASYTSDEIAWWENSNNGSSWSKHSIDSAFTRARGVHASDIDNDGDIDIVGAAYTGDEIAYWENINGDGLSWNKHVLDGDFDAAWYVYSADLDNDGDADILGAAGEADEIAWWENDGSNSVLNWNRHSIDNAFDGTGCVTVGDVNGDNILDILGSATGADEIAWWKVSENEAPYAAQDPLPTDGATNILRMPDLEWMGGDPNGDAVTYDIYLDTNVNPISQVDSSISETFYHPGLLEANTTYYWKVVTSDDNGHSTEGPVWSFTTVFYGFEEVLTTLPDLYRAYHSWGDFDNDGDMDLAIQGLAEGQIAVVKIYENTNGTLTELSESFLQVSNDGIGDIACIQWADINNDGWLDLAYFGYDAPTFSQWNFRIYYNNGDKTFSEFDPNLANIYQSGDMSWGDYDSDGDLDLAICGFGVNGARVTTIYNNTDGAFTDASISLPGVNRGDIYWIDFDKDGDIDLSLGGALNSGHSETDFILRVYKNEDGNFTSYTDISNGLGRDQSVSWGDLNGDGYPDLISTGESSSVQTSIFINNSGISFSSLPNSIIDVTSGNALLFDFDNDSDLDILIIGELNASSPYDQDSRLYENNGNASFTEIEDDFPDLHNAWCSSADVDGDGLLDILITGQQNEGVVSYHTEFYRNISEYSNNWLKVKVVGNPYDEDNPMPQDGSGAWVKAGSSGQWYEINGDNGNIASHSHFGLSSTTLLDRLVAYFPINGDSTVMTNVACNQTITLTQSNSSTEEQEKLVEILSTIGDSYSDGITAGFDSSATDGYDSSFDIPKPPAPTADYVYIYFPHPEWDLMIGDNFLEDIRGETDLTVNIKTFDLIVQTDQVGSQVNLNFTFTEGIPDNIDLKLYDNTTGEYINLRTTPNYSFEAQSSQSFSLIVGGNTPLTTANDGWHLMSIPSIPNGDGIALNDLVQGDSTVTFLFKHNPGNYYSLIDTVHHGAAYWLAVVDNGPATMSYPGNPLTNDYTAQVDSGWSLVGDPLLRSVPLTELTFTDGSETYGFVEAVNNGWVGTPTVYTLHTWDNGASGYVMSNSLDPWYGYWLLINHPGLTMTVPLENTSPDPIPTSNDYASASLLNSAEWLIPISISNGKWTQQLTAIGCAEDATIGFDPWYDIPSLPVPANDGYIEMVSVVEGATLYQDIRSPLPTDAITSWTFLISGTSDGPVTLTFDQIDDQLPEEFEIYLIADGQEFDLREINFINFEETIPSSMEIRVVPSSLSNDIEDSSIPKKFAIESIYPNPFNPTTTVRVALPKSGNLRIEIFDLLGKRVSVLTSGKHETGRYSFVFNGSALPSGIYFTRVNLNNEKELVQKMVLIK